MPLATISGAFEFIGAAVKSGFAIAGLLVAAFALLCAIWGTRMLVRRWRESLTMGRDWPRAMGVVTDVRSLSVESVGATQGAAYEFSDLTGRTFAGVDWQTQSATLPLGSPIEIMYDPADPDTSYATSNLNRRIGVWAALFIPVIAALYGCAAFAAWFAIDAVT